MTVRNWITKLLKASIKVEQAFYVQRETREIIITCMYICLLALIQT
jgi:hypothetical protein